MKHIKTFQQLNESFLSDRLDAIKHRLTKLSEDQIKTTLNKVSKIIDIPVDQLGDKELIIRRLNEIKSGNYVIGEKFNHPFDTKLGKLLLVLGVIGIGKSILGMSKNGEDELISNFHGPYVFVLLASTISFLASFMIRKEDKTDLIKYKSNNQTKNELHKKCLYCKSTLMDDKCKNCGADN